MKTLFSMLRRPVATFVALILILMLVNVSAPRADNRDVPSPPTDWVSTLDRDHPLVGKIYATASNTVVSAQDMGRALALARFVLLGEIHDNPDHHLWQAWAIRAVSKLRGARIVEGQPQIDIIAMEMIRADQYAALDRFYGRDVEVPRPRPPKALARFLEWDKSGWPDFKIYEPIISQALYEQLVIVPASPSKELSRKVSKDWDNALSQGEIKRLGLDIAFSSDLENALTAEIGKSHCGLIAEAAFPAMARVQRFRDATMADAMLSVGPYKGAILIAGNGHVRRDRGVPFFLMARGVTPKQIVSIAHVEVRPGETNPAAYVDSTPEGKPAVDYVVFTPRTDRPEPCEKMRKDMSKGAPTPSTEKKSEPARNRATDVKP